MLAAIVALSVACVSLGTYGWYQNKQKDKIAATLAITRSQLLNLNKQVKIERDLYSTTLSALQQRELETRYITSENNELKTKLREILRNEEEDNACLNSNIPDSVRGLLTVPAEDNRGSDTSVPTGTATEGL